jgi:hypothetical protein
MFLILADFLSTWGGGGFRHTGHKTTDILHREARKLGDIFPTCKDNRNYNIHIEIKLKTVLWLYYCI